MAVRTFESVFFNHPSVMAKSGWDANRGLQFGRASWSFRRDRLDVIVTYKNLADDKEWILGSVPTYLSDEKLLEMFAEQWESHTPGDWIIIGTRLLALTIDRGIA